jgi:NAD(P)-dependent dehydrogenase (short-subunit alcohol dehydrogenase family)
MELRNKVVVITGSGGGLGEACARRFTAEGAKVVVTDIDAGGVERVSQSIGSVGLAADITVEANVQAVAELARRTYGEIDLWFSNAGYAGSRQPGDLQGNDLWDRTWNLHVMSHVYATRAVLPAMLARGDGYLVQTASVVALAAQADKAAYSVTKHAALALAEWLALTFRPKGIKVSCFCPGPMLTPMLLSNDYPPDHPVLRAALTPEEAADLLVSSIRQERFLILDSDAGESSLRAKAADYEKWLTDLSSVFSSPDIGGTSAGGLRPADPTQ